MKKIFILSIVLFILVSCWTTEEKTNNIDLWKKIECKDAYNLWNINKADLKLKWVVITDDLKTVVSPMAWIIDILNCNAWKRVFSNTLIAKILPDFNNPNVVNLSIQKSSLVSQKTNLESMKSTTISNFDSQISDLKEQIIITEKNIWLTKKSSSLSKNDLNKQVQTLEDTLKNLETTLELTKKSKNDALEKIDISRTSLLTNLKSIWGDNLLKIDEVFWYTEKNKDLNNYYEDYISARDTSLLTKLKADFFKVNNWFINISNLSDNEISILLWELVELDNNARKAMKNSVANVRLPQTQIDSFYTLFLNYWNNLAGIKSSWDGLENSKSSTITTFDTQIASLENQINTTKTSLDNLKTNKIGSVDVGLDLQLSTLDSNLKTLNTNLNNLISTKESQVLSLDNQILQIKQSIDSLNTNLSVRNIYANTEWVIKQKNTSVWNNVWVNTSLCQIYPNKKSTKIKIYSPVELKAWDKLIFDFWAKSFEVSIENVLVYKDPITQNYIYESNYLNNSDLFKDGEILTLKFTDTNNDESVVENEIENNIVNDTINNIPVWYVINKINWNFLKVNTATWVVTKKVRLWPINWNSVEILDWLDWVNEICK